MPLNFDREEKKPIVSVIIPTFNSSRTLRQCLESIKNQDYGYVELVVVDRYSSDSTREIANSHNATLLLKGPERSAQKNYGAKYAKGDFIYFVDSDFILENNAISKCVSTCTDFDGVTTINYSFGRGIWGKSIELKEWFLAHDPLIQNVRFIRKGAFLDVGGFDEDLVVGEDLDLYARLNERGYRIGSSDAVEWHVGEPESLREIVNRSFYYGKVVRAYFGKRGAYARKQLSPFKPDLYWSIVKTGNPYLVSLVIVDLTRLFSSILGLFYSLFD